MNIANIAGEARKEAENKLEKVMVCVNYLVDRLKQSSEQIVTDKTLRELMLLKILLEENRESIETEEYHNLSIDIEKNKSRIKENKEYAMIRSKKHTDITVEETVEGNICLITQKEIEERVEAPCGHAFDKQGLIFLYNNTKGKKKFQCPYVGCKSNWYALKYNPLKK
ncbi:hypothetical protein NEMIN01_2271 [Nematocida minor]|uniref:uncharacterized protein n=1 Tax=Nematocida minor TaxID=1912983 RepID=UPI00221FACC7|nr:uncharacterized protein NEMIN01_2271 [Nematocida minor]KAI5192891.1 hypothetical protein NEMIN01_2271 [Nematocida minor]